MVDVRVLDGPPGSGKTRKLLEEVAKIKGKYVIAQPRQELIDESREALKEIRTALGLGPLQIEVIHSKEKRWKNTPVAKQIEEAPKNHRHAQHVVVFVTHEGLMSAEMSAYNEWSIYIDETPNSIKSGELIISAIAPYLSSIIELEQISTSDWAFGKLTVSAPLQEDVSADTCMRQIAELFKFLRTQRVVCFRATDFNDFAGENQALDWFSLWDFEQLSMFRSITVSAAGFDESFIYRAMAGSIKLTRVQVGTVRAVKPQVQIHYFTSGHRGSTSYWKSPKGKNCLLAVANYLKSGAIADCYWSANDVILSSLGNNMPGLQVSPKQEGSNKLTAYTTAVMIYSAKTQPGSDKALCELLDISEQDVEKARELEDIKQFVMRGKIRDQTFDGVYSIYVYDKFQADVLEEYINRWDIGVASAIPVDAAGIMNIQRPQRKSSVGSGQPQKPRKRNNNTLQKDRERKNAANAAKRAALEASGDYRPPGRPAKASTAVKSKKAAKPAGSRKSGTSKK